MQKVNSPLEVLTKDDLVGWFMHPVTKKVRHKIEQEIARIQYEMGRGFTVYSESSDKTAMKTAREVGKIEGLDFVFDIEPD